MCVISGFLYVLYRKINNIFAEIVEIWNNMCYNVDVKIIGGENYVLLKMWLPKFR